MLEYTRKERKHLNYCNVISYSIIQFGICCVLRLLQRRVRSCEWMQQKIWGDDLGIAQIGKVKWTELAFPCQRLLQERRCQKCTSGLATCANVYLYNLYNVYTLTCKYIYVCMYIHIYIYIYIYLYTNIYIYIYTNMYKCIYTYIYIYIYVICIN